MGHHFLDFLILIFILMSTKDLQMVEDNIFIVKIHLELNGLIVLAIVKVGSLILILQLGVLKIIDLFLMVII